MARIVLTEQQFKDYCRRLLKEDRKKEYVKKLLNESLQEDTELASLCNNIEEEFGLKEYEKAYAEYRNNPVTYTLDEVVKDLDLA